LLILSAYLLLLPPLLSLQLLLSPLMHLLLSLLLLPLMNLLLLGPFLQSFPGWGAVTPFLEAHYQTSLLFKCSPKVALRVL
jgi:hypothetical protein